MPISGVIRSIWGVLYGGLISFAGGHAVQHEDCKCIHRPISMDPTCHHCKWYAASEYYAWPQIWVWGVFCCVIVVKVNVQVYGPEPL